MALPPSRSLSVYRGDTWARSVIFRNEDGTPAVLPATGWLAQVRRTPDGPVAFTLTVDATLAAEGIITLSLLPADTFSVPLGKYKYDLQNTESATEVRTYVRGDFNLDGDITRV